MTDANAQEDLAFVRAMAEEGRNVPLVGGSSFMLWGGLIGSAAMLSWFNDIGIYNMPFSNLWLWTGAIIIGWVASIALARATGPTPGASTFGNKTAGAAWFGCGVFITIFWLSIVGAEIMRPEDGFPVGNLGAAMFSVAFGLYGLAFMVSAVAANVTWMRWVAVVSWVISSGLLFALNSKFYMLLAALGTYAVVFVPGFILYRNQPSTTV